MENKNVINVLLKKPLWQMTGDEYVALHAYACTTISTDRSQAVTHVKGVHAAAEFLACSESQVHKLLREGVLATAIVSRIGKAIVFDGDEARRCANEYQIQQRAKRHEK